MTRKPWMAAMTIGIIAAFSAGDARAGFLGHTIHSQYFAPSLTNLYNDQGTQVVASTATFTAVQGSGPFLRATFTDTTLRITAVFGGPQFFGGTFNGFSFIDAGGHLGVSSFRVDPSTNMPGFDASRVQLSQGRLLVNFAGLGLLTDGVIALTFAPATVPEPSSLAMASGAVVMGSIALVKRRHIGA